MSRYCGEHESRPILEAAQHWKLAALIGEGSVFSNRKLWTKPGFQALDRHFVQNLEEGEGTFLSKLKHQIGSAPNEAKQLAAEMCWVLGLCPSNTGPNQKRENIRTIWSWSGETLAADSPWLSSPVLTGVGSAGPAFNFHYWRELVFLIRFATAFQALTVDERQRLLASEWDFGTWLMQIPEAEARQFRHMLLYLLFPDSFERIFGQQDRKKIVQAFAGAATYENVRDDPLAIDRTLLELRRKLESENPTTDLDFYLPPLKTRWQSGGSTFTESTEQITAAHVVRALEEIDLNGVPRSAQSTTYDLIHAAKRYPPKYALALAAKYANGVELDRGEFSGGDETPAFGVLRDLGFNIERKDAIPNLLTKFLAQAQAGRDLSVQGYLEKYRGLKVRVSFGKGNFARIPWVAFLAEGQEVSQGIYPVLLFFREQKVLLVCYGVSEENTPTHTWGDLASTATVEAWFQSRYGHDPDRYGESYVVTAYEIGNELPIVAFNRDLDQLIEKYRTALGTGQQVRVGKGAQEKSANSSATVDLPLAVSSFAEALHKSHVSFGSNHTAIVTAFIGSLLAKPLLILTGLSGSGKTQIALRFGDWLGADKLHVAAVRPDWTGPDALLGYVDGLKSGLNGQAAWHVPDPLKFILRAAGDPKHPYLLLLDEMNLAHVERYFSDVLSGMESGQRCIPNLKMGKDGEWRMSPGEESHLPFPRNVWVVGTVNVDETTYMFSPKVLDRANTFEFRVGTDDLQFENRKPSRPEAGDAALIRGLLSVAIDDGWQHKNPASFAGLFGSRLKQVHALLARYGLEFGHRSFYEAIRFAALAEKAGLGGLDKTLDRVIMQKILPRLHGSRRKLELPILALLHFCRDLPDTEATEQELRSLTPEKVATQEPKLPTSFGKLTRMWDALRANQFVSFSE
jgi:5-methylcytosine-specific restriction protein B